MVDIAKAITAQLVPDVVEGALEMGRSGVRSLTSRVKRKMGGDPTSAPVPAKVRRPVARTREEDPDVAEYDPFDAID